MTSQFGNMLRGWREARRFSQLDLGLSANVSAKHISFLETGRARPSRPMVLHLGSVLEVPRASRNAMLHAAGFAPAYRARQADEAEMGPINAALDWMLERHEPYPAMVLDRHWKIVRANAPARLMIEAFALGDDASLIDAFMDSERLSAVLENWEEVVRHMVRRLRTESLHLGGDAYLDDAATRLAGLVAESPGPEETGEQAIVAARYRFGAMTLSLFSTISQFSTAEDIALADWKIEHLFPADAFTREFLASLAGGDAG